VERFARAARERNIRLCFVRLFLGPQEDKMAANEEYLRLLDRHFRRAFLKPGPARPFESLRTPRRLLLLMGMGLLAALLLALNRLGLVSARPGMILLVVGTGASVALLVVSPDGYRKLAALGAGILFPTWAGAYAFSAVRKGTEGERRDGRGKGGTGGGSGREGEQGSKGDAETQGSVPSVPLVPLVPSVPSAGGGSIDLMAIISKHSKSGRIRVSKEIEQQLAAAAPAAEAGDVPPFRPGQKVRHPQFGEGLVLEASGSGQGATVKVAFPEAGCKSLALAYVKLEVVDE
jgi:hypothetical protein